MYAKSDTLSRKKRTTKVGNISAYKSSEYIAWGNMIQRCLNPNSPEYVNYGGRGITVCNEWQGIGGFINFITDIGAKPQSKLTLERIDCNGNYEPKNVIWADTFRQSLNKRTRKDNNSGYRGVSWSKSLKKWTARIKHGYYMSLGYFDTPEEAAVIYDAAAIQAFGHLAKTNILGDF